MKLFRNLNLHSSKSQERDDLIASSLAGSSLLSSRLFTWSKSETRGRLFAIKFDGEWRSEKCLVMQWYQRQQASSTVFQSIEHRRGIEGPFYHEYLLLKLTDGAVCRVERMGDGSRADAIRHIGCTSYDLIQWFPKQEYDSVTIDSQLIAEIDVGREFDILDVLATCYAVQKTKPCSVYTLQRYNCYFLCLIVLAVLTRRVTRWEASLSERTWDACVKSVLDDLSSLPTEEANKHVMLRLCAVLDSDNPHPSVCVINALRQHLVGNTDSLAAYIRAMSGTLWRSSWESELSKGLQGVSESATATLLKDESRCAVHLQEIITMTKDDAGRAIAEDKHIRSQFMVAMSSAADQTAKLIQSEYESLRRMRQLEHPVPLRIRVLRPLIGIIATSLLWATPLRLFNNNDDPKCMNHLATNNLLFKYRRGPQVSLTVLVLKNVPFTTLVPFLSILGAENLGVLQDGDGTYIEALSVIEDGVGLTIEVSAIIDSFAAVAQADQSHLRLMLSYGLDEPAELAALQCSLVVPGLVSSLSLTLGDVRIHLVVCVSSENEQVLEKQDIGVAKFQQTYIKRRIDEHAKRVEQHRLAAASLVCQDIERTMEAVWKSLPIGFGRTVMADEDWFLSRSNLIWPILP